MIFYLAIDGDGKTWIKPTKESAKDINDKVYEQIDVPDDKPGRMAWIQQMLDETINAPAAVPETLVAPKPLTPSYTQQSVFTDELWEALPLARKFHFASMAMEDGREILTRIKLETPNGH